MLHILSMDLAFLMRWAGRIMSPLEDLAQKVLKNFYDICLDWEISMVPSSETAPYFATG